MVPQEWRCREYLAGLRWPHGFWCPDCGSGGCWRTGAGLWMCAECGLKTSATAGTIFHRSYTPLSTWFAAIWFVTSQKNRVSARGLQDALGFGSYETAWAWLHKLRRAMVRPERELLSGVIELDQSFLGGRSHGRPGGSTKKAPITIAVERLPSGRLGRVRLDLAGRLNGVVSGGVRPRGYRPRNRDPHRWRPCAHPTQRPRFHSSPHPGLSRQ